MGRLPCDGKGVASIEATEAIASVKKRINTKPYDITKS